MYTREQLKKLNKTELVRLARELGIRNYSRLNKQDLVDTILTEQPREIVIEVPPEEVVLPPQEVVLPPEEVVLPPEEIITMPKVKEIDYDKLTPNSLKAMGIIKLKKIVKNLNLNIPDISSYNTSNKLELANIIIDLLGLKELTEEDLLKQRIRQLYEDLQKYSQDTQENLLKPYFRLVVLSPKIMEKEVEEKEVIYIEKEKEQQIPYDEKELELPYEERVRTISSSSTGRRLEVVDPEDISNILRSIEQKEDDLYPQLTTIRKNVQKCLGLV